jgi:hypothetical protein
MKPLKSHKIARAGRDALSAWKKSPETYKNYYVNQYIVDNKGIRLIMLKYHG